MEIPREDGLKLGKKRMTLAFISLIVVVFLHTPITNLLTGLSFSELEVTAYINLIYAIILVAVILTLFGGEIKREIKKSNFKFKDYFSWVIGGVLATVVLQLIVTNLLKILFGITTSDSSSVISDIVKNVPFYLIVTIVLIPIIEEVLFRRALFKMCFKKYGLIVGMIISAFVFAFIHLNIAFFAVYFVVGLLWVFIYYKTKNITVTIIIHAINNAIAVMLTL